MPLEVGQRLGDYEVQQMLGVGGMGHVYRVRNIISNRTEAMKVLLPDLTAEPDLATRFISEIRTLASFDHPNIAQLHTALIAENQLIMMMEYVEGYTLEQLARQRALPVGEVAGYISQALSALSYAHTHGIVHRDVKPANLMVTSHGIVKLMDFGIAKSKVDNNNHTRPGTTMGSLYYMSPEQVRGDTVDPRSDIYSTGIVLYELLAGRRPFEAETTFTILNKQLNEPPQPPIELNPQIPAGLNAIILIALAKDPAQRFQNADAFRNALKSFCSTSGTQPVAAALAAPVAASAPASAAPSVAAAALSAVVSPASATSFGTPVSSPSQFPPIAAPPPAYAQVPQPQTSSTYAAAKPPRNNKPLWIATGAIAAVLALVAVGIAVPHWMKTRAAASASSPDTSAPADASVVTTPAPAPTIPTPSVGTLPPSTAASASPENSSPPPVAQDPSSNPAAHPDQPSTNHSSTPPRPQLGQRNDQKPDPRLLAQQQQPPQRPQSPQEPQQSTPQQNPVQQRELGELKERMVDMTSRASSARRQVSQIRTQQEQMGLGLRGDVESAESRLDSYLRDANSDLQRGNTAAAAQDLNKAEPELKTLEKFLGH